MVRRGGAKGDTHQHLANMSLFGELVRTGELETLVGGKSKEKNSMGDGMVESDESRDPSRPGSSTRGRSLDLDLDECQVYREDMTISRNRVSAILRSCVIL